MKFLFSWVAEVKREIKRSVIPLTVERIQPLLNILTSQENENIKGGFRGTDLGLLDSG